MVQLKRNEVGLWGVKINQNEEGLGELENEQNLHLLLKRKRIKFGKGESNKGYKNTKHGLTL